METIYKCSEHLQIVFIERNIGGVRIHEPDQK